MFSTTKLLGRFLSFANTSKSQRQTLRKTRSNRPQMEELERRELLAADWFSTYLPDAAVANLARNDWNSHAAVNRADMLAIYTQVEKDGVVSSNELSSLKFLASYGNLLNMSAPVQALVGEVVSTTDVANLHYMGTNLGYLTVNSSAGKLQNLVNKWFMGMDHPTLANGSAGNYTAVSGSLFGSGGPKYTDIFQGALGDCTYLASLAATAARSTSTISSMFTANGDNTWTVRFYRAGAPVYVTVDNKLPSGGGLYDHPNGGVLWAALAEKALAQLNEEGWLGTVQTGVNSYSAINNGNQNTCVTALSAITGKSASAFTIASNGADVATAMAAGKLVVLGTGNSTGHANIEHNHAYAVVGYNASASQPFTIFNPWGINGGYDGGNFIWGQFTANGAALKAYFAFDARTAVAPGSETLTVTTDIATVLHGGELGAWAESVHTPVGGESFKQYGEAVAVAIQSEGLNTPSDLSGLADTLARLHNDAGFDAASAHDRLFAEADFALANEV